MVLERSTGHDDLYDTPNGPTLNVRFVPTDKIWNIEYIQHVDLNRLRSLYKWQFFSLISFQRED